MKKLFPAFPVFLLCILLFFSGSLRSQTDGTNDKIVIAISKGDASELSAYLNNMVDLSIPGNEDTYGKTQATRILQDFFSKNPMKSDKTSKQDNSNDGSRFFIGKLESGNKIFRVYYLVKQTSGKYLIHQLQIQEDN